MALQRVTLRLTELRCITQSESGGSEPYLWPTYFAIGAVPLPGQTGNVATVTPAYDAYRASFPDNVTAGEAMLIPPIVAETSFDMDLDLGGPLPKVVGCIAVVLEQDETPESSIVLGRIAYAKEIDKQLNALIDKRIAAGDSSPITDEEIRTIRSAVQSKVEDAVGSDQSIWDVFRNQDDTVGFTFRTFTDGEIQFQYFDFPEIRSDNGNDRYVLSGGLSLGPVPEEPIDLCKTQRTAVTAKQDEIQGLQSRIAMLQNELQHASPSAKGDIVDEINATSALLTEAEAELPALEEALQDCIRHHQRPGGIDVDPGGVVVNPG